MKLPIPIFHQGNIYEEVEITKPKAGILADTSEHIDKGDIFSAMFTFVAGSITEIKAESPIISREMIKTLIRNLPFRSAEIVTIGILKELGVEDGVEGLYECPLCHSKQYAQIDDDEDLDTRDYISNLSIRYMENIEGNFTVSLQEPIEIKDARNGNVLSSVESITLHHPTLIDTIRAFRKQGNASTVRRQFAIYAEALEKIGDEIVDTPFRNLWAMYIFEKMDIDSLNEIGSIVSQYGMDNTVQKSCGECGKKWKAELDTSNFFVSGLRPR